MNPFNDIDFIDFDQHPLDNDETSDLFMFSTVSSQINPPTEIAADSFFQNEFPKPLPIRDTRRRKEDPLSLMRNNKNRAPKKEYIRCKLIRGHKRANRQIEKNVLPQKTLNSFSLSNPQSREFWEKMIQIYHQGQSDLAISSQTESGPLTDGKKKRAILDTTAQKSFNNKFCYQYFECQFVRKSFYYYVNLLFSDFDPQILCQKFALTCCVQGNHNQMCCDKWAEMKRYMQEEMIEELKLEPFTEGRQVMHPFDPDIEILDLEPYQTTAVPMNPDDFINSS